MSLDFVLDAHAPSDRKIAPKARKQTGAHYTPHFLAKFVAERIVEVLPENQSGLLRIIDPAVGDGELLTALYKSLNAKNAEIEVTGFDTLKEAIDITKDRFVGLNLKHTPILREEDFVPFAVEYRNEGSLFPLPKFDVVIANPPYVRTQVLGSEAAQSFAELFGLTGRVDLYHVFLCGISAILRPGGIAGVIVSNRFMTTRGGTEIRRRLLDEFEILHVWDLGDTRIFEAAVLPAVLLLRKKTEVPNKNRPQFTSVYMTDSSVTGTDGEQVIKSLELTQQDESPEFNIQKGHLEIDLEAGAIWRIETPESNKWLETVKANTCCTFEEVGKIRVGVKTTADKVFIHSNWTSLPESEQPEILRPLITHHIARSYRPLPIETSILYPHEVRDGRRAAIDLDQHPVAKRYLESHRETLESREYVMSSGRKWYEIWVPQDPESWEKPKVVFRDISSKPMFWIDLSGAVVNGDCYWLTNDYGKDEDILWLVLAVANSTFIEAFYDKSFNNKLYSGRRRFMTQYVQKFPLPNPFSRIPRTIIEKVKELVAIDPAIESLGLEKEIDRLVWQSFGLDSEEALR